LLRLEARLQLIFPRALMTICMEKENKTEQPIIADTSALVSLATDTDHNHKPAIEAANHLIGTQRPIIIPSDVFVETVNVLGKRSGHETALKAAERLLRPNSQFVLIETTSYIEQALKKFETFPQAVSFTDCIVMAVADEYDTLDIFGFDKQFADAGYHRLEPSKEWRKAAL
jgi:predicted nucleic acid-binding protein